MAAIMACSVEKKSCFLHLLKKACFGEPSGPLEMKWEQ